ncbi:hypothetical protein [Rhizobium sp. MHM7A]|uniref:hypothetical protein n=1 Tax=Rhizobium sp. MHM7A TaxID=2583233 RepID=UPI001106EA06|nr:hypothetical protein [Rhizobium sp. MHM7A]TLX17186.1 hypothetical protein FFR93_07705 [Rhizobium sp. MHM7A]
MSYIRSGHIAGTVAVIMTTASSFTATAQESVQSEAVDVSNYVPSELAYKQAARVYGFLYGQHRAAETLSSQYPQLAGQLSSLEQQFAATYGWPEARAKALVATLSHSAISDLHKKHLSKVDQAMARRFSAQEATTFASELQGRLEGKIDPEVLKNILWLKYASRPVAEMVDGYTVRYNSSNHPKSKGIEFSLSAPISWRQVEGDRPNTVQQWTSQNGSGDMSFSVLVKSSEELRGITEKDVEDLVAQGGARDFLGAADELIASKFVHIDGAPTVMIDAAITREMIGKEIGMQTRIYNIFQDAALLQLNCSVGRPVQERTIAVKRFSMVKDLCDRVAISFSIANRYQ